ncbi:MAG: hypothetical protein ABN502_18080, partial [Gammaproteobacteria bacterium]
PKRRRRREKPEGRRAWMHVVFRRDRMSRRKIPLAPRTRSAAAGAKAGVLDQPFGCCEALLLVTFLCTSKEK